MITITKTNQPTEFVFHWLDAQRESMEHIHSFLTLTPNATVKQLADFVKALVLQELNAHRGYNALNDMMALFAIRNVDWTHIADRLIANY